jgi:hypothetical protein
MSKKPVANNALKFQKKPRVDTSIITNLDKNPSWQIRFIDHDGLWSWSNVDKETLLNEILPKLKDFETMYWKEILNRNNHEVSINQISKEAQKRLHELQQDDIENLVSLRLTGPKRIWGIKSGNTLKLLWWDPEHTVYPSNLKHT